MSRRTALLFLLLISPILFGRTATAQEKPDDVVTKFKQRGGKFLVTGFFAGWSGDGKRIVYGNYPPNTGLQIVEVATRKGRELSDDGKDPTWSSLEGGPIAYVTGNNDAEMMWLINTDGERKRLVGEGGSPRFSPDGKTLYYHSRKLGKIMSVDVAAGGEPKEFCLMQRSWYPAVSPDGKQVAVVEKGAFMIVNAANGETVLRHPLPTANGGLVDWSREGKRVAFGGYGFTDGVMLSLVDVENKKIAEVVSSPFTQPMFSPDGKHLAVDLRYDGKRHEIWIIELEKLDDLDWKPWQ